jgi:hypothetical protein
MGVDINLQLVVWMLKGQFWSSTLILIILQLPLANWTLELVRKLHETLINNSCELSKIPIANSFKTIKSIDQN